MLPSLQTGASGMKSHSQAMTVTGSNIANSNTFGYKTHRAEFGDLVATQFGTTKGAVGQGSLIKDVSIFFNQGGFENSDQATDMAIEGKGFFILKDKQTDKTFYTRDGTFEIDKSGFLVDYEGNPLMVKDVNNTTRESQGLLKAVDVKNIVDPARATGNGDVKGSGIVIKGNLSKDQSPPSAAMNLDDVREDMYNFATTTKAFDGSGGEHTLTIAFRKLADIPPQIDPNTGNPIPGTAQLNVWAWFALSDGGDIKSGSPGSLQAQGGGFLQFTDNGRLVDYYQGVLEELPPINPNDPNSSQGAKILLRVPNDPTAKNPQVAFDFKDVIDPVMIGFDFGDGFDPNNPSDKRDGLDGMNSFTGKNSISRIFSDGNKAGEIEGIRIDSDGVIDAIFDSGSSRALGKVQLATFIGEQKLSEAGRNRFVETSKSGAAIVGDPTVGEKGSIRSGFVEKSNIDLGREFVNMIEYQRGFQANTKVISTSDEMLRDLIDIKR
ncbi:MAG: flagellar hook protein FlgE [SAR324 cluster bacterium]|nr:flagellar hook protein FlgE [SAR324 cluster bacterium]